MAGKYWICLLVACSVSAVSTSSVALEPERLAQLFGSRPTMSNVAMSPRGDRILYLTAFGARESALSVADVETGDVHVIMKSNAIALRFTDCVWANDERIVCELHSQGLIGTTPVNYIRTMAMNSDGSGTKELGRHNNSRSLSANQVSGSIIDLLPEDPDNVLMAVGVGREVSIGTRFANDEEGLTVQRVNINTGKMTRVEKALANGTLYMTDQRSQVRLVGIATYLPNGYLNERFRYLARKPGEHNWTELATTTALDDGITVQGFDDSGSAVYLLKPHDGRLAMFRRPLDGGADTLVFAHPNVDVDGLVRFGRLRRPVGVQYSEDFEHIEYFDPAVKKMAAALHKALPDNAVTLLDESWDGNRVLVFAAGDTNPGVYYIYDKSLRQLIPLSATRPNLEGVPLAEVKPIRYAAADGTMIPGYLTLPPGLSGKGLPLVVLPHGGPSARDVWGFDWLTQYLALSGYAVLQPNYRGSAGFGSDWRVENAFRSWRQAVSDINDGVRWAVGTGVADGNRLAILGWSYGGYAALQANVVEPSLYRAVVAIAPVTDLAQLKNDARDYTNARLVAKFVGDGPHVEEGSPARHADRIQAPVSMFFGTKDLNVDVGQGRLMQRALQAAGKPVEYVEYDGLEHQLNDSVSRTDMLNRISLFLAKHMPPR